MFVWKEINKNRAFWFLLLEVIL